MEQEQATATMTVLLEQAERLRQGQDSERSEELLDLIVFRLGEECYALPVEAVRGVIGKSEITPLPGTPRHLLGLTNMRGEILSVIDFKPLLGIGAAQGLPPYLVVARLGEHSVALAADSCPELLELPASCLQPMATRAAGSPHLRGQLHHEGGLVFLLELGSLLEH